MRSASAIDSVSMSHTEAITDLPQIITYTVTKKRIGAQRKKKQDTVAAAVDENTHQWIKQN